jgi:hypothetical protein
MLCFFKYRTTCQSRQLDPQLGSCLILSFGYQEKRVKFYLLLLYIYIYICCSTFLFGYEEKTDALFMYMKLTGLLMCFFFHSNHWKPCFPSLNVYGVRFRRDVVGNNNNIIVKVIAKWSDGIISIDRKLPHQQPYTVPFYD